MAVYDPTRGDKWRRPIRTPGNRLRELRIERGITLERAAADLGISAVLLRKYESTSGARAIPPLKRILAISRYYEIPVEETIAIWNDQLLI